MFKLDIESAIKSFITFCSAKNLSPQTITYYQYRLKAFVDWTQDHCPDLTPETIKPACIRDFMLYEKDRNSASTANHSLCALKAWMSYLVEDGYIEVNPALSVKKQKTKKTVIETYSPEQIQAVLATCRKDFCGVRDRAILLLLLDTGVRVSELCGIKLSDINWSQQTIKVTGKGNIQRNVPFGQGAKKALISYVARRGDIESNSLFVTQYADPVDRYRVREMIMRKGRTAGIEGIRCSPHTWRHTFSINFLRSGGDVFSLQRLLGHSSLEMTRRYCESLSAMDVQAQHAQHSPVDNLMPTKERTGRKRLR